MKNLARPKIKEPQGMREFQNILLSNGKILPQNYWHSSGKWDIQTSKFSTWKRTVMAEPRKIYISEIIGGWDASTTTRGIRRAKKCIELMPGDPSYIKFIDVSVEGCG